LESDVDFAVDRRVPSSRACVFLQHPLKEQLVADPRVRLKTNLEPELRGGVVKADISRVPPSRPKMRCGPSIGFPSDDAIGRFAAWLFAAPFQFAARDQPPLTRLKLWRPSPWRISIRPAGSSRVNDYSRTSSYPQRSSAARTRCSLKSSPSVADVVPGPDCLSIVLVSAVA